MRTYITYLRASIIAAMVPSSDASWDGLSILWRLIDSFNLLTFYVKMTEAGDGWQQRKPYQQSSASSTVSYERPDHHDNHHHDNGQTQQQQQQRHTALHATWKSALETNNDDDADNWNPIEQPPTNSGRTRRLSVQCRHIVRPTFDPASWKLTNRLLMPWITFKQFLFCFFCAFSFQS